MGGRAATVLLAAARLDEVRWSEMCFCDPPLDGKTTCMVALFIALFSLLPAD